MLNENVIRYANKFLIEANEYTTIPKLSNCMTLWHGGDLSNYDENLSHKKGRVEYGPGLYTITNYAIASKYSKGSRKLYLVCIEKGTNLTEVNVELEKVFEFVNNYVIKSKREDVIKRIEKLKKSEKINMEFFNNIVINEDAIKNSNQPYYRKFLVELGIDYYIVNRYDGYNCKMIVLFNQKKLKESYRVKPTDRFEDYDLDGKFED